MQLHIRTSNSNSGMIPINGFKYIYEYARCSKCNLFIALQSTNTLYGGNKEFSCIHEMNLPFQLNTDLFLNFLEVDKGIVESNDNFFVPEEWNWVILPEKYWTPYIMGELDIDYDYEKERYNVVEKKQYPFTPIEQIHMFSVRQCNSFDENMFFKNVEAFLNRLPLLSDAKIINDIHLNPIIQEAYNNKTSAGRFVCQIKTENINIVFYFFKSLFSLAKADTLDLMVRFDKFESHIFMASFLPKKKKNPLSYNPDGFVFKESVHCMYINMI